MKKTRRAKEPKWIHERAFLLLHQESLVEHGGRAGLLSRERLDSALARPRQILSYEHAPDLARLAAAYASGLVLNRPFTDGNKRAAFLFVGLFLELNGLELSADQVEAARTVLALAADKLSEVELAEWIRAHSRAKLKHR